MDSVPKEVVEDLMAHRLTYKDVSSHLKQMYPNLQQGLSERSIHRFCQDNHITHLQGSQLDELIEESITEVTSPNSATLWVHL